MNLKSIAALFAMLVAAQISFAETTSAKYTEISNFRKINGAGKIAAKTFEGENVIEATGVVNFRTDPLFAIDNKKIYKFSGDFKVTPDTKPAKFYFGIIYYDAAKRIISPEHILFVPGSLTEVVADAAKGATVIKVKDASKWKKGAVYRLALNAKADCSDLPNRNIIYNIKNIEQKDGAWEITFSKGIPCEVKTGTIVREQHTGSSYSYSMTGATVIPADWKNYSALIKGESRSGRMSFSNFWPGAKFVSFIVLGNNGGSKTSAFMLRNFTIEEITR